MTDTLGGRIAWARERRNMTLRELAERTTESPVGRPVSHQSIAKHESGQHAARSDVVRSIAWALDVDAGWLLTGDGEPEVAEVAK